MIQLNTLVFLLSITEQGVILLLPPIFKSAHLPVSTIGFLVALIAVGRLASRVPGGILYGSSVRRVTLPASVLLVASTSILFAFPLPLEVTVFLVFIHGVSYGLATTMLLAICMEIIRGRKNLAAAMGWYTAFLSAGNTLGSLIAGYLADNWGFGPALASMALAAVGTLVFLPIVSWPTLADGQEPAQAIGDPPRLANPLQVVRSALEELRALPSPVYLAILLAFYINFLSYLTNAFYPLWALQLGLSLTLIGTLKSLYSAAGTVVRLFLGVILERVDYRLINNVSLVLLAGATSVLSLTASFAALTGAFITLGVSRGVVRATSATYAAESAPSGSRFKGLASGVYSTGLDLGSILGPGLGGIAVQFVGLGSVFWVLPVCLLIPCLTLAIRAARAGVGIGEREPS